MLPVVGSLPIISVVSLVLDSAGCYQMLQVCNLVRFVSLVLGELGCYQLFQVRRVMLSVSLCIDLFGGCCQ